MPLLLIEGTITANSVFPSNDTGAVKFCAIGKDKRLLMPNFSRVGYIESIAWQDS